MSSLTNKEIYDLNHMNRAAQNVNLGTILNALNESEASPIESLTDKQINDLNKMNTTAQSIGFGTIMSALVTGDTESISDLTDEQQELLNGINVACQRCSFGELVQDCIDLSRADDKYRLTVISNDTTKGTVTGGGMVQANTSVTITANATLGNSFSGWYDVDSALVSANNPYTFSMPQHAYSLTGTFVALDIFTISYYDGDSELSGLTPSSGFDGQTIILPGVPEKESYTADGWYTTSDFQGDAVTQIVLTANTNLYAKYTSSSGIQAFVIGDTPAQVKCDVTKTVSEMNTIFNGYTFNENSLTLVGQTDTSTADGQYLAMQKIEDNNYVLMLADGDLPIFLFSSIAQQLADTTLTEGWQSAISTGTYACIHPFAINFIQSTDATGFNGVWVGK